MKSITTLYTLAPIAIVLCLPSCSRDERYKKDIVGIWRLENEKSVIHFKFQSDGTLLAKVKEKGAMGGIRVLFNELIWNMGDYKGSWTINDERLTIQLNGVEDSVFNSLYRASMALSGMMGGKSDLDKPIETGIVRISDGGMEWSGSVILSKVSE